MFYWFIKFLNNSLLASFLVRLPNQSLWRGGGGGGDTTQPRGEIPGFSPLYIFCSLSEAGRGVAVEVALEIALITTELYMATLCCPR